MWIETWGRDRVLLRFEKRADRQETGPVILFLASSARRLFERNRPIGVACDPDSLSVNLRRVLDDHAKALGLTQSPPVRAYVTSDASDFNGLLWERHTAGCYGTASPARVLVYLHPYATFWKSGVPETLVHELAHVAAFRVHGDPNETKTPWWVYEGTAEMLSLISENKKMGSGDGIDLLSDADVVFYENLFSDQAEGHPLMKGPSVLQDRYAKAARLMRRLDCLHGRPAFLAFLGGFTEGKDWKTSLQDAFGTTPERCLAEWRAKE